ncbi:retropepsin-like aspartic protease [Roseivirga sp.]|uniref:retropepsin-like aspartic protease n=1 Tax=Roseivirga sp. TaxID=1964215 RepID=UPI003B51B406
MKRIFLSLLLLICFSINAKSQEYPISITPQGYIFVQVNLNDSIPFNFMLDTGAGIDILSQKAFDRIAESTKEVGLMTGFRHDGDRLDGLVYEIPSLSIGETRQERVKAAIYPPLDNYGIDGLISLKFFEDHPVTINFKTQKLSLPSEKETESLSNSHSVIPLQLKTERDIILDIFIPVIINGEIEMHAEFDTGSGFQPLILNPHYIEKLKLSKSQMESGPYKTPISAQQTTDYFAPVGVSLGEANNIRLLDKTATFRENLIFEALIGSEIFKDKAITIDIPRKRLIIH